MARPTFQTTRFVTRDPLGLTTTMGLVLDPGDRAES